VAVVSENPLVCRHFGAFWESEQLLAMQKVEGSNPFSRSQEGLHLQGFFVVVVE
jgi:hypothetical protein